MGEAVVSHKHFDDVCAAHHPLVAEMMDTRRSDEDGAIGRSSDDDSVHDALMI